MKPRVAIVDAVQTDHADRFEENVQEILFGVVRKLMDRVGIDRSDIGTLVSSSSDYWQGISCSNSYYYDSAGANLKSGSKVTEDSVYALIYGVMRILSGHYRTALVVSSTKSSECPSLHTLSSMSADPIFQRPVGLNEMSTLALQAAAYLDTYRPQRSQVAGVAVKNLANAELNPHAHRGGRVTAEEILASPVLAHPLRSKEAPDTSDGACALLLAEEHTARELTDNPVYVLGLGWSADGPFIGDRDLLGGALPAAAQMAYKMANISDPAKEIDVAEVCDVTALHEILWSEQLGLSEPGVGGRRIEEGAAEISGDLPINPSGGLFGANPYVPRGLIRVCEAAAQVKGVAGDHQVSGVNRALAHGLHGLGAQSHTVVILGS